MMRQYELVERVLAYNPSADEALLNKAYIYAMKAHGSEKRASGDPYFSHPLEVAAILTRLHLDDATIAAALLHDTVEDTEATHQEIEDLFGAEVARIVDGLTKIEKLGLVSKTTKQAENLRKLLLAVTNDVRVLFVKLADRLHNMRTLHFCPIEKRVRVAQETMDIYAPLAARIGMQWMREELEDLSFHEINPEAYKMIASKLDELSQNSEAMIAEIQSEINAKLAGAGIEAHVTSRRKQPYSIWRKLERNHMQFEQLFDIFGFRILVDSVEDCYRVLGFVHTTWQSVPGRFKDFISTPKSNEYRSLHTTVIGSGKRQRVELQIRTHEMHQVAEYGIAAHSHYKDGVAQQKKQDGQIYDWLRHLIDVLQAGDTPEEFLENTKLELFHDQVFCFTPKGRLITLPRSATPIDFAYAVHTDIGNSTVGCRINGAQAPLTSVLRNGDEVEIIRTDTSKPPAAWEHIVVTGKARSAIRRASREVVRTRFSVLGQQLLNKATGAIDIEISEKNLDQVASKFSRSTSEDLLVAIGSGEISVEDVLTYIFEGADTTQALLKPTRQTLKKEEGWFGVRKALGFRFRMPDKRLTEQQKPILGLQENAQVIFSAVHGAVPGDRIVGILQPGEGVHIYPIHSKALRAFENEPSRWLDVVWNPENGKSQRYPIRIHVFSVNEPGALAMIAQIIFENDTNIDNLTMHASTDDFHEIIIDLGVYSLKHLTTILRHLNRSSLINKAYRSEE